jgi:hypothetical protein
MACEAAATYAVAAAVFERIVATLRISEGRRSAADWYKEVQSIADGLRMQELEAKDMNLR